MSIRHSLSAVSLSLPILLLAACGGGGGDGGLDTPTPLSSKADVARELGNLVDFVSLGDTAGEAKSSRGTLQRIQQPGKAAIDCDSGSADEQTGTAQRDFALFDASRSVEFSVVSSNNCRIEGDDQSDTITFDGVTEEGSSATGADGIRYEYQVQGSNGSPASLRFETPGTNEFFELSGLGVIETALSSGRTETRALVDIESSDYSGYSSTVQIGQNGEPLTVVVAGTRVTVDGAYQYSSTECPGGSIRVATPSALTFGANFYPNGGELRLTSGDRTATVQINLDGSATVQLPDGGTETLSSSEARSIFDNGSGC